MAPFSATVYESDNTGQQAPVVIPSENLENQESQEPDSNQILVQVTSTDLSFQ